MGRSGEDIKPHIISARVSDDELLRLKGMAKRRGVSLSEVIRDRLLLEDRA